MSEIKNKVAESGLISLDPESLRPAGERMVLDISNWLYEGMILREKDFREKIRNHDWRLYEGKYVCIVSPEDAIIPSWAFMLVAARLEGIAIKSIAGSPETMESQLYSEAISKLNPDEYRGQRVVIRGCSTGTVPVSAYMQLTEFLKPLAASIMYGEPCSTVPVYKKKT
ncbi:MAG: DUF2480 family protein [Bacteroidia bacterium]|nr:DUF2480 family protein [Bacteroidia bacterium]